MFSYPEASTPTTQHVSQAQIYFHRYGLPSTHMILLFRHAKNAAAGLLVVGALSSAVGGGNNSMVVRFIRRTVDPQRPWFSALTANHIHEEHVAIG